MAVEAVCCVEISRQRGQEGLNGDSDLDGDGLSGCSLALPMDVVVGDALWPRPPLVIDDGWDELLRSSLVRRRRQSALFHALGHCRVKWGISLFFDTETLIWYVAVGFDLGNWGKN